MRLNCNVKVHCQNGGGSSRSCISTLALVKGAKDPKRSYLIHFSSANKSGKRYKISENVDKLFTKFSDEGKTTISFKEPEVDLMVKADPVQLKVFLSMLSSCLNGIGNQSQLTGFDKFSSLGVVAKNTAPTKLVVLSSADIPIKGLPRTLQTLHMTGLGMQLFKREILSLRSLQTLDLSNNNLSRLPSELGNMPCLSQLVLKDNQIGYSSPLDWKWIEGPQIIRTLKSLDISFNAVATLPNTISKLRNLVTLKIDDNSLTVLPMGIGAIRSLRFLSASKNKLIILPASLTTLRLEKVDFSFNYLNLIETARTQPKFKMNTLVELCSSTVIKCNIPYTSNTIPFSLVDYLDNCYYCVCGKPNFNVLNYSRIHVSLASFCESVVSNGSNYASFECYLCSPKCYNYCIKKNSDASSRPAAVIPIEAADHQIVIQNPADNQNYFF